MRLRHCLAAACFTALGAIAPSASAQQAFATPEAAANAFLDAVATNDDVALRNILGANYRRFIPERVDAESRTAFLYASSQNRKVITEGDKATLSVGRDGWTLPVPIMRSAAGWRFDAKAGAEEMRIRRIGRNELSTMQALLAYVEAQRVYAKADRNGDGVVEYAQRFASTPGKRDGLIWGRDPESPLGPYYADESKDGVYHGYRFRILSAQGAQAAGGAKNYIANGRMTQGFAAVAWPAKWNDTGVMTFIVNQDGQLFQKNLGPKTDAAARTMKTFNPEAGWTPVSPSTLAARP